MRLSVALCTYNGARYLREQLQSIAEQSMPPDEIVVCDDGSTDETLQILNGFAAASLIPVRVHADGDRVGVVRNFERAISRCSGDVIALADQDDVWLPEKLKVTVEALERAEKDCPSGTPILVHTDLWVVDSAKNVIAESFREHQGIRKKPQSPLAGLLVENYVTGCTVAMNRTLKEESMPIPGEAVMHDWWLALVAAARGRIVTLPTGTILYRQHGSNAVGAGKRSLRRYVFGWKAFFERVEAPVRQSEALLFQLRGRLEPETESFLDEFNTRIRRGGPSAVYWMMRNEVRMQSALRTAAIFFLVAVGAFRRRSPLTRASIQ